MASRLQRVQRRMLELMAGDLRMQVATLLLDETDGGKEIVYLSQSTLAELLAATRPSVNSVLKDIEREGAVELGYRQIRVVDAKLLRRSTH